MVLDHDDIRRAVTDAWRRSEPDSPQAHEEGGFVVLGRDGSLSVIGWPRGLQNEIVVPAHRSGRSGNLPILATFHTHPNSGPEFQQEPSLTDIRAVRDDPQEEERETHCLIDSCAIVLHFHRNRRVIRQDITTSLGVKAVFVPLTLSPSRRRLGRHRRGHGRFPLPRSASRHRHL